MGRAKPRDNIGDEHDDGLWPDYATSAVSVSAEGQVTGQPDADTKITEVRASDAKRSESKKDDDGS